jgi:hypothetical protein
MLGASVLAFGKHEFIGLSGTHSEQTLGGTALLGTSILILPSLGRWLGGDPGGATANTLTRALIVVPGAALAGLYAALIRDCYDCSPAPAYGIAALTAAAVLLQAFNDIRTTPSDLMRFPEPSRTASNAILAAPFIGTELTFGGNGIFPFNCGSSDEPMGTSVATGALLAYRVSQFHVGVLFQESFGRVSKSCFGHFDLQSTKVYLELGRAFVLDRLTLSPHLDLGIFHLRALPRPSPDSVTSQAFATSTTGAAGRAGLAVDWSLSRRVFVGGDVAFDVMAYGNAAAGGTISARVGFVL